MQVDFNFEITNFKNETVTDPNQKPLVAKECVVGALMNDQQDEQISGAIKMKRFKLAERIYATDGPVEIESEEATMIKEATAKSWSILVYGRIHEAVEK